MPTHRAFLTSPHRRTRRPRQLGASVKALPKFPPAASSGLPRRRAFLRAIILGSNLMTPASAARQLADAKLIKY
jgi:hypothetical protein